MERECHDGKRVFIEEFVKKRGRRMDEAKRMAKDP